jgi:ribonuclease Y
MFELISILAVLVAGSAVVGSVFLYNSLQKFTKKLDKVGQIPAKISVDPRASKALEDAKTEATKIKQQAEEDAKRIRSEARAHEQRTRDREVSIDRKLGAIDEREKAIEKKFDELMGKSSEVEKIKQEQLNKLEKLAGLSKDEARQMILEGVENRLKEDIAKRIKDAESHAKEVSDDKAREIIVEAMQRVATDYVPEYTVSRVKLPSEDMKARIIGREGRNIQAFEKATGVDINLDELPGEVQLSSFDGVRREIARVSLERLIADGRIQPARIEEIVEHTKKDIEKLMFDEGTRLVRELGIVNLPRDLVAMLGRFKYRFSYGQNMILHTLEETKIATTIANELGADVQTVKLGALLHDIGKTQTAEAEGTHIDLGVDIAKRFGMPEKVVNIIGEHHEDKPFSSLESIIVWIADAISGSRPGARHENVEEYIKRIQSLENIAGSFKGVEKSYAISAGREVRVIVIPSEIDDASMTKMANDIATKIHDSMVYPGQVKVTVIRENRAVAVAK